MFLVTFQIQDYFAARAISRKTLERNRVMQKRIGDEVAYEYSSELVIFQDFCCPQILKAMATRCSDLDCNLEFLIF